MERYIQLGAAVLAMVAFVPAFIFLFRAGNHFGQMLNHFKSGRHSLVPSSPVSDAIHSAAIFGARQCSPSCLHKKHELGSMLLRLHFLGL